MMHFACPFCHYKLQTDAPEAGKRVLCPACKKSVVVPASRFEVGCIIGDFLILAHLGAGTSGMVFLAQQISLERQVALKLFPTEKDDHSGKSIFLNEARAAAQLSHANLVQSIAVGEEDGFSYMALTYIRGETLKSRLSREKRIPVDEALHIVQQIAEALYYAWEASRLIHRDVKPDNIMLTDDGIAKLTDLGLAMYQQDWRKNMDISGSPSYMSPEQFSGEPLDTRTDIYSLGITLYQMITGMLPFRASAIPDLARQHILEKPEPPENIVHGLPNPVASLIKKMIAKKPGRRFANMEELLNAIWKVRQITAPNKSYIPAVHTISIRRLNYEIQNEYAATIRRRERLQRKNATTRSRAFLHLMFILLPVTLIVAILIFMLLDNIQIKRENSSYAKIDSFERLASDPNIPYSRLVEEAEKAYKAFEEENRQNERLMNYISSHLNYLLARRAPIVSIQNQDTNVNNSYLEDLEYDYIVLSNELYYLQTNDIPLLKSQNEENLTEIESLENELYLATEELKQEKSRSEQLKKEIAEKNSADLNELKDNLRQRLYQLLITGRFSGARQLLSSQVVQQPELIEWIVQGTAKIDQLENVYKALTPSLDVAGSIEYLSSSIIVSSYRTAYPTSTIPDDTLIGAAAILSGNLKTAAELMPGETEITATADAVSAGLLSAIRTLHTCKVPTLPEKIIDMINKLPNTPKTARNLDDIQQLYPNIK